MSVFEYVMVLVSIIIGLAIAQMLDGILRVLRTGRPYRTYWVHSVWVGLTFLQLIAQWSFRWAFEAQSTWTLWEILFFILPSVLLFLLAGLLFPRQKSDLRSYYFQHSRIFFGLWIALYAVYSVEGWWLGDAGLGNRGDYFRLLLAASCVPLALGKGPRVHGVVTIGQAVLMVLSFLPVLGGGDAGLVG